MQQGEPVVEIVNPKRLKVEAFVPGRLAGELDVGQKVNVRVQTTTSDGNPTTSGELKFIDISVQPVTQEIRVWAEVDNSNGNLKPGQLAEMEIIID